MNSTLKYTLWRMLPVVFVIVATAFWFNDVQSGGPYVERNFLPLALLLVLAGVTLYRGDGRWGGSGKRMPLAVVGYAVPTLGLAVYLHYAYSVNLDDMFTDSAYPDRIFQYLPFYTVVAGGIGFVIGWIVGRNV